MILCFLSGASQVLLDIDTGAAIVTAWEGGGGPVSLGRGLLAQGGPVSLAAVPVGLWSNVGMSLTLFGVLLIAARRFARR